MYDELVKRIRYCSEEQNGCKMCALSSDCVLRVGLLTQAADAIEELSKPKWIPAAEQIPGEYTTILFISGGGQVHVGYYDSEHKSYCDMTGFRYTCTHWMPLPEPPKEE